MAISGAEYKAVPVNVLAAVAVSSILAVPKSHIFSSVPFSNNKILKKKAQKNKSKRLTSDRTGNTHTHVSKI